MTARDLDEIAQRKCDGLLWSHGVEGYVALTVAERDALVQMAQGWKDRALKAEQEQAAILAVVRRWIDASKYAEVIEAEAALRALDTTPVK